MGTYKRTNKNKIMNDEELEKKWKCVLDYTNEYLEPLKEEDRLKCARELEETEQGEGGYIYKINMVPAIRGKYSNIPIIIEHINGSDYLVTDVSVIECIYEKTTKGEFPKWKNVDKRVKWYFPILEDKSDNSYERLQNIHVFGRGYTDGIYHMTPKYGTSEI
jgi:hypothetical protein